MTWEFEDVSVPGGGGPLSPYADWEQATRAEHVKDVWTFVAPGPGQIGTFPLPLPLKIELPLWQPVYIRVRGTTAEQVQANARKILRSNGPILVAKDAENKLGEIATGAVTSSPAAVERYQIVHLLEPAYVPADLTDALEVLHVGPAVPGVSIRHALMLLQDSGHLPSKQPQPGSAARDTGDGGTTQTCPPVVTAVIDAEIGIANERFRTRTTDGKTRVQHFWRQQREIVTPFDKIDIGREFDADAINGMLRDARGDERRFYELMRRGDYGTPGAIDHDRLRGTRAQVELLVASLKYFQQREADARVSVARNGDKVDLGAAIDELQAFLRSEAPDDAAVLRAPPYVTDDQSRPLGLRAAHGSFVTDLAAGAPQAEAPQDRPIVAVELPDHVIADTAGQRLEIFCLMGVRRILNWVDDWQGTGTRVPVVINISLGNTAGPRDGTGFLEAEIARLVAAREAGGGPATKVVIAAGNSYRARLSAGMQLLTDKSETLDWRVPPGSRAPAFLEIRMPAGVEGEIAAPGGDWAPIRTDGVQDMTFDGKLAGRIYGQANGGGGRLVTVALAPTLALDPPAHRTPAGGYRLRLTNRGDRPANVKIDVQRNDTLIGWPKYGRQSRLDHPALSRRDPETGAHDLPEAGSPVARDHTLSAHATSPRPQVFVVGGAVAGDPPRPTRYTGAGPTYGRRVAPDLAALSEDGPATPGRRAAGYLSGSTTLYRGTSSAAPQIARRIVEHLAQVGDKTKDDIVLAALHPAGVVSPPDPRLGRGVVAPQVEAGRKPRRGAGSG